MFPSFVSRRACPLKTLHEANKILPGAESADDREFMCSYSALRSNGNTLALCQSHHAKQLEQGSTSVLLSDTSFPFKPIVALCFFLRAPSFLRASAAFCLRSSDARNGCTAGDNTVSHRFRKYHLFFQPALLETSCRSTRSRIGVCRVQWHSFCLCFGLATLLGSPCVYAMTPSSLQRPLTAGTSTLSQQTTESSCVVIPHYVRMVTR